MTHNEVRTPYQRDVDKFPYALPFRRLAHITQVISDDSSGIPHNRMTHSMKVAQVGHRLALGLHAVPTNVEGIARAGGLEADVVYAAGLAHDIGHPPFGHIGEQVLDEIARKAGLDGFEGNAQTYRVLATLTRHYAADAEVSTFGMNLSDRTLAASVKYPWARDADLTSRRGRKWGYYPEDVESFSARVKPLLRDDKKTLEAQVMDWADDITYAVHDVEDFYTSGQIPLHRLKQRESESGAYESVNPFDDEFARFWQYAVVGAAKDLKLPKDEIEQLFRAQAAAFPEAPFSEETAVERARVGRWVSDVISEASEACSVDASGQLKVTEAMRAVIAVMKQLTWYYVIDRPEMVLAQSGQARVLRVVTQEHTKIVMNATRSHDDGGNVIDADRRLAARRKLPAALVEIAKGNGLFSSPLPTRDPAEDQDKFAARLDDHERRRLSIATRSVIDFVSLQTEQAIYEQYDLTQHGRT